MATSGTIESQAQTPHARFADPMRRHVLMITNHGVHEWNVVPGLPDTGGQNVYVNQFTEALVALGYRVTIVNRGGYPHPKRPMKMQTGMVYHPSGHARIVYLEDGKAEFVRKEDMDEQLPALAKDLTEKVNVETFDMIISHYWDAGKLGNMVNGKNGMPRVPHIWIPHSLGALKKRNMDPSTWENLRIDERINNEKDLIKEIDGAAATSTAIRDTFLNDYDYECKFFLPPCIDEHRFHPLPSDRVAPIYPFLAEHCEHSEEEIRKRRIITEVSRTDRTKRKDVLIKAFAEVRKSHPDTLLAVSIDPHAGQLHDDLQQLIDDLDVRRDVVVLGSVWAQLPILYNATHTFVTPSVMEGFGMTSQEAAATGKPVISSDLVPFVCEYLIGPSPEKIEMQRGDKHEDIIVGKGGIVVPADFVEG
ncbi:MAG: glycosyltransferase, partial [Planctomycetota bacterium]